MFDLDKIEQDWQNNSFRLSEEEIIKIYQAEGITLKEYEKQLAKYNEQIHECSPRLTPEERLLRSIYNEEETIKEIIEIQERIKKIPKPERKHLSEKSQKRVIEGSLFIVFDSTRYWYNYLKGRLSLETIYYLCLDALMECAKYMLHNEKTSFRFYVNKIIDRNIIKYISRKMHISYKEAYTKTNYGNFNTMSYVLDGKSPLKEFNEMLNNFPEEKEEPEKPSKIFYRLKDKQYDVNYTENILYTQFMKDYYAALDRLDYISRQIMLLSFDSDGYRGFTSKEIGDFLGIDSRKVSTIRSKTLKKLRKNEKIKQYL